MLVSTTYKVAIWVLFWLAPSPIHQDSRAFVLGTLYDALDPLLALWADHWTQIHALLKPTVNIQSLCSFCEVG